MYVRRCIYMFLCLRLFVNVEFRDTHVRASDGETFLFSTAEKLIISRENSTLLVFSDKRVIKVTPQQTPPRGTLINRNVLLSDRFGKKKKKKTTGILPCRSPGSDGRIPWRATQQDRVLDAGVHARLPNQKRLQETAGATFGSGRRAKELEEIPATSYLAMVETVAES